MCVANHEEGPRRRRHLEVHLLGSDRQSLRLDKRLGHYFLEWWDGNKRCRENAGETPSQALEAQRRKTNELIGEMLTGATRLKPAEEGGTATPIAKALELFTEHVRTHSPAKPATHQRYRQVLAHFERILGKKKYMEAVTRSDMDDYK